MKTYSPYDFENAKKRIEKTKVDPYKVQLEDYENINDLVQRSVRTKSPLKNLLPEKIDGAQYDSDEIIDQWLNEAGIQTNEPKANEASKSADEDEQSEVKTADVQAQAAKAS